MSCRKALSLRGDTGGPAHLRSVGYTHDPAMSYLQIGLFIAGVLLVIGVILYNRWQERRARARLDATRARPIPGSASSRRSGATMTTIR